MPQNITAELLADLRKKAEAAAHEEGATWALTRSVDGPERIMSGVTPVASVYQCSMEAAEHMVAVDPATTLALLDRIDSLQAQVTALQGGVDDLRAEVQRGRSAAHSWRAAAFAADADAEALRNGGDR